MELPLAKQKIANCLAAFVAPFYIKLQKYKTLQCLIGLRCNNINYLKTPQKRYRLTIE
jgi:hypothetical protein